MNAWAWTLPTALTAIGFCITTLIAAIGWGITHIRDKKTAKTAENRFNEQIATLKAQLKVEQDSAEALRAQASSSNRSGNFRRRTASPRQRTHRTRLRGAMPNG